MDIRRLLGMVLLGSSVALAGCGDSGNGGTDSGPTDGGGDDGGGGLDLPMAVVNGEVDDSDPQGQTGGESADFSCMGSRTAPSEDGTAEDFEFTLQDFQTSEPVADTCVNFYADNTVPVPDDCGGTMTNDSGVITVSDVPDSWYAYQVFPREGATAADTVVGLIQVNEPAATGGVTGNSVSAQTLNLIPTLLGITRVSGSAIVAGAAEDCNGDAVYGATIRVYTSDGTLVEEGDGNMDPQYNYGDGGDFPSPDQPFTHVDALYFALNVPVESAGEEFTLELWANIDGEAQVVGCETSRLLPDGASVVNVGPMRSDGPTCPGAM